VHRFEALHGGLGIMADDFAAALAAGGTLWLVGFVAKAAGAG
jgi:phosphatidylglycerophosphatase A